MNELRRSPYRLWIALGWLLLAIPDARAAAAVPNRVLLLHSYGQDFAPYSDLAGTLRDDLVREMGGPVDLMEVSVLTDGSGATIDDIPFVEYLHALLVGRTPDLVVSIGGPASNFIQRQRQRLFPATPTIYAAVDQRTVGAYAFTDNDAVVASDIDVPGFVQNVLDLLPDTTHIAVILGKSSVERYWKEQFLRDWKPFMNRIEFTWLDELPFEEMKTRVAQLPPHSAVLYALLMVDAAGVPRVLSRSLREISDSANAPVFGVFASNIDRGVIGGRLVSDGELGHRAAEVAVRILHGESPGSIQTPPVGPGAPVYNWKELQRWGIREANLPPGSLVRFREPTVWERYRLYLLAGLSLLVLQSGLIVGFLWQRVHRRRAERETVSLSGRLLVVHENERRRVARELHDDVTQRLATLAIDATRMEGQDRASADKATRAIRDGLIKLSEDVHALSYRLHPSVIEDLGLVEALRAECDRVTRSGSIAVRLSAGELPRKLHQDTALCLFRVAQEALRNVVRHAEATSVSVSLLPMHEGLQLAVSDDGRGFDSGGRAERPSLGLASIRERVNLLHGEVEIDSSPGRGTTVFAWVPMLEAA